MYCIYLFVFVQDMVLFKENSLYYLSTFFFLISGFLPCLSFGSFLFCFPKLEKQAYKRADKVLNETFSFNMEIKWNTECFEREN